MDIDNKTPSQHGSDKDDKGSEGQEKGVKVYEESISPQVLMMREKHSSVSESYERKVAIMNKVMNDHIGMGRFQWQLFLLSGFGWFVDNVWLQGVAVIMPAVRAEFGFKNISWMLFALYIGLILGASIWGVLADIVGRRLAFNVTLALSGIFGIAAGGTTNVYALGGVLAAMGFGLGGNLPVDGMLFLEFIPGSKQYLLTLLSVFWSLGQLFSSLIAWVFIANYSCSGSNLPGSTTGPCLKADNMGWRYTYFTLGGVTFVFFILRFIVFQLPESPKFLLSQGRDAEAVRVLKEVARRNGKELDDSIISVSILRAAAGEEPSDEDDMELPEEKRGLAGLKESCIALPRAIYLGCKNFKMSNVKNADMLAHVRPLFATPSMAYTTSALILIWGMIGMAYPLFNSFLPLYLQSKQIGTAANSVSQTYTEYLYISLAGVPGSIIAAWLVDIPRTGRRGAMALGTALTGIFVYAGTAAPSRGAFLAFNCVLACVENIMYGVLYGYTPETFPAPHRGTGDAITACTNRIFGLMAPIINIYAGHANPNAPLFTSGALFLIAALLMVTLRSDSVGKTAL